MPTIPDDSAATRPHFPVVPTHAPTFRPDQLVADRFRILRLLGSGGMGEVYEAVDLELQEHVALKTIKPAIAQDERVIARFKQEAFLARQVTHPNICRIFDLFVHRAPPAEGSAAAPPPGITFVTMQLLSGPTLAERLHGQRLTTEEALPIITQMAAALDAAHQVGVVHRDLKSNNVMLVPGPEGGPPRAIITDFGLAWRASDDAQGRDTPSTVTGEVLGTPDYMAPEQVEAGAVTPATDVYALGLVMYEMVTGVRPFAAATPLAAAARRLTEAPPSPSLLVPDLDPSWEAAILRCLERQPADRFQRAGEVVAALEHGAAAGTWRLVIGGALLVALAVGLAVVLWREPSPPAGPSPGAAVPTSAPRQSIAVLGFKNVTGRADAVWLSTAFAEMLTTELAAGEALRTIPGENVARMKFELALADADMYAADTLGKIGSSLGTDLVVFGSYVTIGESGSGTIRLDARLQDARDGATIALVSDTGAESDVLQMVSRTGQRLRERLNIEALPPAVTATVLASQPANLDGARLYAEGLARLRQFDALAARDRLERAVAADGRFPMAHAALALAWSTLGYDERAKASARKAFELSSGLSREERLSVEGAYRETAREWTTAIDIYQTLFRFFPDNLEYGLRLANAQVASGAAKDALATIAAIRTPGRAADPRIDLAEAAAAETVSDFKRMRAAAEAAGQRGEALGARLLVARARLLEGTAALTLGEPDRALTLYDQARATFDEAGDRGALARALNDSGQRPHRSRRHRARHPDLRRGPGDCARDRPAAAGSAAAEQSRHHEAARRRLRGLARAQPRGARHPPGDRRPRPRGGVAQQHRQRPARPGRPGRRGAALRGRGCHPPGDRRSARAGAGAQQRRGGAQDAGRDGARVRRQRGSAGDPPRDCRPGKRGDFPLQHRRGAGDPGRPGERGPALRRGARDSTEARHRPRGRLLALRARRRRPGAGGHGARAHENGGVVRGPPQARREGHRSGEPARAGTRRARRSAYRRRGTAGPRSGVDRYGPEHARHRGHGQDGARHRHRRRRQIRCRARRGRTRALADARVAERRWRGSR